MIATFAAQAVLFDLDGTLADSAPDLVAALNRLRAELSLAPAPDAQVRPFVSKGGMAMLRAGVPEVPDAERTLLERFLALYHDRICDGTVLFPGIDTVLERIERAGRPWGIVTNKPGWLTDPLLERMDLARRTACIVSGDTLAHKKPHPAPVLHACAAIGVEPARTVLVGDDRRDVESALAAGAVAVIADWGYFGADEQPETWGAQLRARGPLDLLRVLELE